MQTKRETKRISIDTTVEVSFDDFQSFKVEYAENLSSGGMYLRVKDPWPVGSNIAFRLRIKDIKQDLAGTATVIWTRETKRNDDKRASGMGLRFLNTEPTTTKFIQSFIEQNSTQDND